jgi:hypothetical protein
MQANNWLKRMYRAPIESVKTTPRTPVDDENRQEGSEHTATESEIEYIPTTVDLDFIVIQMNN